jgi:hypothetical protein
MIPELFKEDHKPEDVAELKKKLADLEKRLVEAEKITRIFLRRR